MKCFGCGGEIEKPETDRDKFYNLTAFCPICGASVTILHKDGEEDVSVEQVRSVFERACGGGE